MNKSIVQIPNLDASRVLNRRRVEESSRHNISGARRIAVGSVQIAYCRLQNVGVGGVHPCQNFIEKTASTATRIELSLGMAESQANTLAKVARFGKRPRWCRGIEDPVRIWGRAVLMRTSTPSSVVSVKHSFVAFDDVASGLAFPGAT